MVINTLNTAVIATAPIIDKLNAISEMITPDGLSHGTTINISKNKVCLEH
jgi:hypothetical protein